MRMRFTVTGTTRSELKERAIKEIERFAERRVTVMDEVWIEAQGIVLGPEGYVLWEGDVEAKLNPTHTR